MKIVRSTAALIFLLLGAACATGGPPPSSTGVALFRQSEFENAYAELAPLARQGDAIAQYYVARMALAGDAPEAVEPARAIDMLVSSAAAGFEEGFALLLVVRMSDPEREAFRILLEKPSATFSSEQFPELAGVRLLSEDIIASVERVAGGPTPERVIAATTSLFGNVESWPPASRSARPSDAQLLHVDESRAAAGDKYAQARLGNRYAQGRGVTRDLKKAFDLRLKAARTTPAQRSCVYQAPVGGGSASTYCYDTGAPVPGIGEAKLNICRAYAMGEGTARNPREARKWCARAARERRWKSEAEAILDALAE